MSDSWKAKPEFDDDDENMPKSIFHAPFTLTAEDKTIIGIVLYVIILSVLYIWLGW